MKKNQNTPTELDMDRLGGHFASRLSMATPGLPHDVSERLRIARQLAMAQRKPVVQLNFVKNTQVNSNGTLTGSGDEGLNIWSRLASLLPLIALIVGLAIIQNIMDDDRANELAEVDAALLIDDLPPSAYADPGFLQFLKNPIASESAN